MSSVLVEKVGTLTGHRDCVYTLERGSDDRHFFSSGGDGMIVQWDVENPEEGALVAKVDKSVYALRYLKETSQLLIGENFSGIHLVSLLEKKEVKSSHITDAAIFDILLFLDKVIVACGNGELVVLQLSDLSTIAKIKLSESSLRSLAISPDHQILAIGSSDHHVHLLSLPEFKSLGTLKGHTNSVFSLCFSPDNLFLLSAGRDAHLKIWEVGNNFSLYQDIVAHMYAINDIRYSSDGAYFATCSMDKSIKIWNAQEFKLCKVIDKARHAGHATSVNKVCWNSDSERTLISCSDDRTISIWKLQF